LGLADEVLAGGLSRMGGWLPLAIVRNADQEISHPVNLLTVRSILVPVNIEGLEVWCMS
jgi:hypothetical protein